MAFSARGVSGEIQVGGRTAVRLGRWEMKSIGGGGFLIEATATQTDDYLIQVPSPRTLKLDSGNKVWQWRSVNVTVRGKDATITGSGKMTVIDRE